MQERELRVPSQKRSIAKKEAILLTAKKLFLQKGYLATNTNEIAETAGLSVGTLYSYFKDKRDIFLCIMETCNADYRIICKKMFSELDLTEEPEKTIGQCIDMLFLSMTVYGNLHGEYINHVAKNQEEIRGFFAQQNNEIIQFFGGLLTEWEDTLRIKDKDIAAIMIFEMGCTMADLVTGNRSAISEDAAKRELCDMVCRYLFD